MSILLLLSSAFAAQTYSPSDFNGDYNLSCISVSWTLSAGIAGVVNGKNGSWSASIPIYADCNGIDVDALSGDTYSACVVRGLPSSSCTDLAATFAEAADAFNRASVAPIPSSIRFSVYNTSSYWNRLLGLYPMNGLATFPDGSTSTTGFVINNNNGGTYGNFGAWGLGIGDSLSSTYGSCTTIGTASIIGDIDRGTPFVLDATGTANASLLCGAGSGNAAVILTVSLGYTAVLVGTR